MTTKNELKTQTNTFDSVDHFGMATSHGIFTALSLGSTALIASNPSGYSPSVLVTLGVASAAHNGLSAVANIVAGVRARRRETGQVAT